MRKILLIFLCWVAGTVSIAQKNNQPVPQQVTMQFARQFMNTGQVIWKAADKNYEAEFKDKGIKKKVTFSDSGQWLVIESPANSQEFPQAVQRSLTQNFAGYQVKEATKMELFGKGVAFRIRVRNGNGSLDVDIDVNGKVRRRVEVVEVYEEHHHHHDDCHHHHCDHGHGHHKHKDKHKHKHKHKHDECEEEDDD